jgi:hypothetical protein
MFSNLSNKLLGGEPRSIIVVRSASVKGFISGALNLGWLISSSLANQLVYIIALIVGMVLGLSQVGLNNKQTEDNDQRSQKIIFQARLFIHSSMIFKDILIPLFIAEYTQIFSRCHKVSFQVLFKEIS